MKSTTVIDYKGCKYVAEISANRNHQRIRKGRLFVNVNDQIVEGWIDKHPEEYTMRGENLEIDRAWDSWNRKLVKLQKEMALAALKATGVDVDVKYFTRYAGCTCPCSAGYVLENNGWVYNVSIDYVNAEVGE